MKVSNFIQNCADGIKDPTFIVMSPGEWSDILSFQAGELFPEIGYRGSSMVSAPTQSSKYQIDLSGEEYANLEDVKQVYLIDSNGKKTFYENWIYNKEIRMLDLDPSSSRIEKIDPADFEKVQIVWQGYISAITKETEDLNLTPPKAVLLKKICIREAIRRILLDHAKLDRYRTLVGRTSEYTLLAMIKDLSTEIEISKRRLIDTNQVRTF